MSHGPELDYLAARWEERQEATVFAALADGLRKRGAFEQAEAVAMRGVARWPEYLPGYVALARIHRDAGHPDAAAAALRAGLARVPDHPVALEELEQLTPLSAAPEDPLEHSTLSAETALESDALVYADAGDSEDDLARDADPVVTESLAMLYHGQGHLDRALEVFEALIARDPGNTGLAARRDRLRRDAGGRRPRPYAAVRSGGLSVGQWLGAIAAARPATPRALTGYDAFFDAPPVARDGEDLEAFQAWLKELAR
ncbi:MAG TPA: tetratricopeptide repeat protein [Gemmatimonadales bacterium]|jgi:tetratricopeptide (TPR) repeat protein|nr:tetratricopeptide repeat protein [Gemmatimonadales bacterium]